MVKGKIDPGASVGEIMDLWPQTVPIFLRYQMGCAGCSLARFETLEDALNIYQAPKDEFIKEIEQTLKEV